MPPEPFALRAAGLEVWKGGIAILRIDGDDALTSLHGAVGAVLERFDIALEARPFVPHVTFARKARAAHPPPARCALQWRASGFALVESGGGAYRVLKAFPTPG